MITQNNKTEKINTTSPFFFFLILYFLIFICYLSSLVTSLHFLFTVDLEYSSSPIFRALFVLFTILSWLKQDIGKKIYQLLIHPYIIERVLNLTMKFDALLNKKPFLVFFTGYSYILLLLVHVFTHLFVTHLDIFIEASYHFLNIIRLIFFPLIIYAFILNFGSRLFSTGMFPIYDEELIKYIKAGREDFSKRHPIKIKIKTKIGSVILGLGALSAAVANIYGSCVSADVKNTIESPFIVPVVNSLNEKRCLLNDECIELRQHFAQLFSRSAQSSITIAFQDFKATVNGDPRLIEHTDLLLDRLSIVQRDILIQELQDENSEISKIFQNSTNSIEGDTASMDVGSSSQIIVLQKSPDAHSPLEVYDFFDPFNLF